MLVSTGEGVWAPVESWDSEQWNVLASLWHSLKVDLLHGQGKAYLRGMVSRWIWRCTDYGTNRLRRCERKRERPPYQPVFQLPPWGSYPFTSPNKQPEESSEPKHFIKKVPDFPTMLPCQLSWEVPGGWHGAGGGHCHDAACHSVLPRFLLACLPFLKLLSAARVLSLLLWQPQAGSVALHGSPLAVYNLLPVVTPGEQPSPCWGQDQVLVVAAGEQDVLPAWGLLLAWDRTWEEGRKHTVCNLVICAPSP